MLYPLWKSEEIEGYAYQLKEEFGGEIVDLHDRDFRWIIEGVKIYFMMSHCRTGGFLFTAQSEGELIYRQNTAVMEINKMKSRMRMWLKEKGCGHGRP
jgi:hypothetical protein